MRRTGRVGMVAVAALVLVNAAPAAGPLASLPGGWSHAAVNVVGAKGKAHTQIYDRGTVTAVGPSTLTLKELDGQVVTVAVAPGAKVNVNGHPGSLSAVQLGASATTMAVDGYPASQVQTTLPPPPPPVSTQGKVLAVGLSSVTLREHDGTVVTIPVAANASVKVNGKPGALSDIQRGFTATAVTVGTLAAKQIRSSGTPAGAHVTSNGTATTP